MNCSNCGEPLVHAYITDNLGHLCFYSTNISRCVEALYSHRLDKLGYFIRVYKETICEEMPENIYCMKDDDWDYLKRLNLAFY